MRDLKKMMPHEPKVCQNCRVKTRDGSYVPTDKYHQEWKCTTCLTREKQK